MPNYVYSTLRFERINDAAKEKFALLQQRVGTEKYFSDLMQDGSISVEERYTREWQHNHVGPKWTNIEDMDETSMTMASAWSPPNDGVQWLVSELAKVDPNLITLYTFQEESLSFTGYSVYLGDELYDAYEDEYEDAQTLVEQEVEGLSEMKDEEGCYTDEGNDLFFDRVYEALDNAGESFMREVVEAILANED